MSDPEIANVFHSDAVTMTQTEAASLVPNYQKRLYVCRKCGQPKKVRF